MDEADDFTTPTAELLIVQRDALLTRLNEANRRIAHLEADVRRTERDSGRLREAMANRLQDFHDDSDGHDLYPAYRIARIHELMPLLERRRLWTSALGELGVGGAMADLYPHDGGIDPMTILVRGSGGFGDMLYLSSVIRGLYAHFSRPRIFVVHEHPAVNSILSRNPYVIEALHLDGDRGHRFLLLAAAMDVFDLVVDVRYAVTYLAPPRSRVAPEFLAQAAAKSWPWQKYVRRDWPFLNNIFSQQVVENGFNKYSFVEHTANVPIPLGNFGDFFPADRGAYSALSELAGTPYVTVHHGADPNMAGSNGLQTKNLSIEQWKEITTQISAAGFLTVQLGEAHEQLIDWVDVDLRGRTAFDGTALALRHAQAHVDTEGGLVHLARAVGTHAIVAFGPTSAAFFGYPENGNHEASVCGNCWWTTSDWSRHCPRNLPTVQCMDSHSARKLASAAIARAATQLTLRCDRREVLSTEATAHAVDACIGGAGAGVLAFMTPDLLTGLLDRRGPLPSCTALAVGSAASLPDHDAQDIFPASAFRIPVDTGSQDWAFVQIDGSLPDMDAFVATSFIFEGARAIGDGALCVLVTNASPRLTAAAIAAAAATLPGARMVLDFAHIEASTESGATVLYHFSVSAGRLTPKSKARLKAPGAAPSGTVVAMSQRLGSGLKSILNRRA